MKFGTRISTKVTWPRSGDVPIGIPRQTKSAQIMVRSGAQNANKQALPAMVVAR